jgi:predicted ATP-grasp superfamily ATP-dependent carboligase
METGLAQNAVDAAERAGEIRAGGGVPLLQERLAGHLEEVAVVADRDGRLVAQVHQKVHRISSPTAGVAVRATTVPPDEALMERVAALMSELGWWGLAELQFIVGADGEHHLIDFNGRFYGSMALALGAGVNLPGT